jgi:hypothetical protein
MMMKPHLESFSSNSSKASTWNRLSHMYIDLTIRAHPTADDSRYIRVDRLERLERKRQLLLLTLIVQDGTDENTKSVIRNSVEQLQFLLSRGDGG